MYQGKTPAGRRGLNLWSIPELSDSEVGFNRGLGAGFT